MYKIPVAIAFIAHLLLGFSVFSVQTLGENHSILASKFEAYREIKTAAESPEEAEVNPGDSRTENSTANS